MAKFCVSHKWLAQIQSARALREPWLWLALNNIPCIQKVIHVVVVQGNIDKHMHICMLQIDTVNKYEAKPIYLLHTYNITRINN